jgi:serine/threonine protein kinase
MFFFFSAFIPPLAHCVNIGDYNIGQLIGSGSFGRIHIATQLSTGISRAIKKPKETDHGYMQLDTEVDSLNKFKSSPFIVDIIEMIYMEQTPYLVLEYLTESLDSFIKENQDIDETLKKRIFKEISQGVLYIHGQGYCHRDIKPANLMLARSPLGTFIFIVTSGLKPKVPKIGFNKFRPSPTVRLPIVDKDAALVKIIDFGLLVKGRSCTDIAGLYLILTDIRDTGLHALRSIQGKIVRLHKERLVRTRRHTI